MSSSWCRIRRDMVAPTGPPEEDPPSSMLSWADSEGGTDSIQRGSEAGKSSTRSPDIESTRRSREESTREEGGAEARSDAGNRSCTSDMDSFWKRSRCSIKKLETPSKLMTTHNFSFAE